MNEKYLTAGIVAEFNPFHSGHEYLIEKTKEKSETVVAVMSGNLTQRCEPAICEKHLRAKSAVEGGVDLVIGLPTRYSIGSAEKFACGAISALMNIGAVDSLFFGSECGDIERLKRIAERIDGITSEGYKTAMESGISFASARQTIIGEELSEPNDILGVEYLRAIKKLNAPFTPNTVKRTDDYHISGTELRKAIEKNDLSLLPKYSAEYLKKEIKCGKAPTSVYNLEKIILAFVRNAQKGDFDNIYGINPSEGMAERILQSATAKSLDEMYDLIKTKRFSMSAVKRAVLNAYLRIKSESLSPVPFVHVLAFSDKGKELLKTVPDNIPVIYNLAKIKDEYPEYADEERRATDLFALSMPETDRGFEEYTRKFQ